MNIQRPYVGSMDGWWRRNTYIAGYSLLRLGS
jgi:hypothetical protein